MYTVQSFHCEKRRDNKKTKQNKLKKYLKAQNDHDIRVQDEG